MASLLKGMDVGKNDRFDPVLADQVAKQIADLDPADPDEHIIPEIEEHRGSGD